MKTNWGFSQFLSLATFSGPSNGYLVDDTCVFGAEVFVTNYTGKGECLSILSFPITGIRTWTFSRFSTINNEYLTMEFIVGARKWYVSFFILHPMTTIDLLMWVKLPISPLNSGI